MKLRSGKVVAYNESDNKIRNTVMLIPENIRSGLLIAVNTIKNFFQDNKELADIVVERSLLIGRGSYREDISQLIFEHYPDLYQHPNGANVTGAVYSLTALIYGDHSLVKQKVSSLPVSERNNYKESLRVHIEQEVNNIYYDVNLSGNSQDEE